MNRVRLYFLDDDRHDFLDANGAALSLTYLRLTVLFKIGPHAHGRDGLLDTGTALTIFPDALWRSFEQVIEWLHPIPGRPIPFWWTSSTGITGHGFPCRGAFGISLYHCTLGRDCEGTPPGGVVSNVVRQPASIRSV